MSAPEKAAAIPNPLRVLTGILHLAMTVVVIALMLVGMAVIGAGLFVFLVASTIGCVRDVVRAESVKLRGVRP